jgi:hypothetical protein
MPVRIKLGLSLLVVLVTMAACYFQYRLGHDRIQYVVAFLGAFMIFAMWLFPEVKREESAGVCLNQLSSFFLSSGTPLPILAFILAIASAPAFAECVTGVAITAGATGFD